MEKNSSNYSSVEEKAKKIVIDLTFKFFFYQNVSISIERSLINGLIGIICYSTDSTISKLKAEILWLTLEPFENEKTASQYRLLVFNLFNDYNVLFLEVFFYSFLSSWNHRCVTTSKHLRLFWIDWNSNVHWMPQFNYNNYQSKKIGEEKDTNL